MWCGSNHSFFLQHFDLLKLTGIDPSSESIDQAKKNFALLDSDSSCEVTYLRSDDFTPESNYDLVYCNGVFHHIPLEERCRALGTIYECLRPGGVFAFWENNPYSLPARYVMSKIPFDHDAIMVWPSQVRELMTRIGFEVVSTDYHFIFPSLLRWMRWSEKLFCKLPLGAVFSVIHQKVVFCNVSQRCHVFLIRSSDRYPIASAMFSSWIFAWPPKSAMVRASRIILS